MSTSGTVNELFVNGGVTGSHTYSASGEHTITLTVTDGDGGAHSATTPAFIIGAGVQANGTRGGDEIEIDPDGSNHVKLNANLIS